MDNNNEEKTPEKDEAGLVNVTKGKHPIHCLTIIGQIEGHYESGNQLKTTKYEHVIPQLVSVEENPEIEGLLLILNTVGGDVEAGLAIAELIKGMTKPTVSLVLGGGHSIGIPLAVSTDYSFIAPSATMTIHPVRHSGTVLATEQTMKYLNSIQQRVTDFVTENSAITAHRFKQLMTHTDELIMDLGSCVDGKTAVEEGIINATGGLGDALAYLYRIIEEKAEQADR